MKPLLTEILITSHASYSDVSSRVDSVVNELSIIMPPCQFEYKPEKKLSRNLVLVQDGPYHTVIIIDAFSIHLYNFLI